MRILPPVLLTPPVLPPISLAEAKAHCRVDHDIDDSRIEIAIAAATAHLDGYAGILGRALVTQTWRQDFPFWPASRSLRLPLAPVTEIDELAYRDASGAKQIVPPAAYRLLAEGSDPYVLLPASLALPTLDCAPDAVSVTFKVGYGADGQDVPGPLRAAMLLLIGDMYRFPETAALATANAVPMTPTVDRLISPYRRVFI